MKIKLETIVIPLALMFWSCQNSLIPENGESALHSDSGIRGKKYSEIKQDLKDLASANPEFTQYFSYGESARGKPLSAIRIGKKPAIGENGIAVMISGATHGDEYLHIADRLPKWFVDNSNSDILKNFFAANGQIYIVPILNPDGYDSHRRENSRGQDLNRDFDMIPLNEKRFKHPETRDLAAFVEKEVVSGNTKLSLTMDYHCCQGSLLYPWSYSATRKMPQADIDRHESVAKFMQTHIGQNYKYGRTSDLLGYAPKGTTKDYFYAKYGAAAFTFEGKKNSEVNKFEGHTKMWLDIIKSTTPTNTGTTENTSLFLAIAEDSSQPDSISLAASMGIQGTLTICKGNKVTCLIGSNESMMEFKDFNKVGSVYLAKSTAEMKVSDELVVTLVSRDMNQALKSVKTVKFTSKAE